MDIRYKNILLSFYQTKPKVYLAESNFQMCLGVEERRKL